MNNYTYSTLLEDFIKYEFDCGFFDKKLNGVYVWAYLRFFIYNIVKHNLVGDNFVAYSNPVIPGETGMSPIVLFEKFIRRNVLFARKKDVLIVSHSKKYKDGEKNYRDWNTGYLNEKLELPHYLLDRSNADYYFYPCKMDNILEYNLSLFDRMRKVKPQKLIVNKNELYNTFLLPIENHYEFRFSTKEKNMIWGYANARVADNDLFRRYALFVLKRVRPKILLIAMVTDSIMQVFCQVAHEMGIPIVFIQEGVIFESLSCYCYDPHHSQKNFFPDYIFCYGDFEKTMLNHLPIDSNRIIPTGFPDLEEISEENKNTKLKTNVMVISSANPYLIEVAGQLSEMLDAEKYQVFYKIHPMEKANYDRETYPALRRYEKLLVVGAETKIEVKEMTIRRAYTYYFEMDWIVGKGSTALFEATKFKKKIAIFDPDGNEKSPLLDHNSAVRVTDINELADIIQKDSFKPDFTFHFYYDNAVENINREIKGIIEGRK